VIGQEANTVAEGAAKKENYRISHEHVMAALEVTETGSGCAGIKCLVAEVDVFGDDAESWNAALR
jgi:hypothetical protein